MRFFSPQLNQEQLVSGLGAAATGGLVIVPVVVSDLIMRHHAFDVPFLIAGFAMAAVPGIYVTAKILTARDGQLVVGANVTFVLNLFASVALVCGHIATHHWSENAYVAALVLPCIFCAIGGDRVMVATGIAVALVGTAICLSVDSHTTAAFVALFLMFGSVDLTAALMVAPVIRRLHNRFRSREAVRVVTETLATAETIEEGLRRCLPLVHTVLPCGKVEVVARTLHPDGYHRATVASWHQGEDETSADTGEAPDIPEEIGGATGPLVADGSCYIPIGYSSVGELVLVAGELEAGRLLPVFVMEAATGLATSLLMMTSRITYVADLKHESRTDPLTGLANRRVLEERLAVELSQASRSGASVTVAMVDLDHFKLFNDRFGHQRGDELLRRVSAAMAGRMRTGDLIARYGGEEFCLVLPDTALLAAESMLDDLRIVASAAVDDGPGVTVSAGVAEWNGSERLHDLVGRADQALYDAKALGRDRVVTADCGA